MRGISVWYVAARTKLPPDRIQQIEDGGADLRRDGHGRATARALAAAIGADPQEGVGRLSRKSVLPLDVTEAESTPRSGLPWVRSISLILMLAMVAGLVGAVVQLSRTTGESPSVVQRTDYLERLLGGDGS